MFVAVHPGVRKAEPSVSELAEHEAEDHCWTRAGRENFGILADSADQGSCTFRVKFYK